MDTFLDTFSKLISPPSESAGNQIVLSAVRSSGSVNLFFGDFGQHCPNNINTQHVVDKFYQLVQQDRACDFILSEINLLLQSVLPEKIPCEAGLIEIQPDGMMLKVWNGALPDILVVEKKADLKCAIKAKNIVLGIKSLDLKHYKSEVVNVSTTDKIFLCSHSVATIRDEQGQSFSQNKVEDVLTQTASVLELYETLSGYATPPVDTLTMAELDLNYLDTVPDIGGTEYRVSIQPSSWSANYSFSAKSLQSFDIVLFIVTTIMQLGGEQAHRQRIYTIIAELYANALEHGLLHLDSSLKVDAEGFSQYYTLRSQRLAELTDEFIKISLQYSQLDQGKQLTVKVEDSGDGFDYAHISDKSDCSLHGRGELLLSQLCNEFSYLGKGNIALATYMWD